MKKSFLVLSMSSLIILSSIAYAQREGDAPRERSPEARQLDGEGDRPRGPRDGEREGRPRGPRDGEERRERPGPPPNPLLMALDTDKDGEISEKEISNAIDALKKLDKNGDGKLSGDEIHPPRPQREGDRRRGGREGDRRAEGDRPPRDGDRPPREGRRRGDGDRPPREGDRPERDRE